MKKLPLILDGVLLLGLMLITFSLIFGYQPSRQAFGLILITNILSVVNLTYRDWMGRQG